MTQVQFEKRCAAILKEFERRVRAEGEAEARLRLAEDRQMIYVRTYTVQAYLRRKRPRPATTQRRRAA